MRQIVNESCSLFYKITFTKVCVLYYFVKSYLSISIKNPMFAVFLPRRNAEFEPKLKLQDVRSWHEREPLRGHLVRLTAGIAGSEVACLRA